MKREFIILPEFEKRWRQCGLDDGDLRELEYYLCLHPESGDIILDPVSNSRFFIRGEVTTQ